MVFFYVQLFYVPFRRPWPQTTLAATVGRHGLGSQCLIGCGDLVRLAAADLLTAAELVGVRAADLAGLAALGLAAGGYVIVYATYCIMELCLACPSLA